MAKIFSSYLRASLQVFICTLILCSDGYSQKSQWTPVADGLEVAHFKVGRTSIVGDSTITVIRIDPAQWGVRLLSASETGGNNYTTKQWCEKYHLVAVVNAGMFQADYKSNVGYMKNYHHLNNPNIHPEYNSIAAFNPAKSGLLPFRIFDSEDKSIQEIIKNYNTVIQNLRLIKRPGENRWSQQSKIWSEVVLGQDKSGNVLFIFCRSPYSMHDFNDILIELPIDLVCAQHLEGGPEAQLYLKYGDTELEMSGSYETNFFENDENIKLWPIPNVIGIAKK